MLTFHLNWSCALCIVCIAQCTLYVCTKLTFQLLLWCAVCRGQLCIPPGLAKQRYQHLGLTG